MLLEEFPISLAISCVEESATDVGREMLKHVAAGTIALYHSAPAVFEPLPGLVAADRLREP